MHFRTPAAFRNRFGEALADSALIAHAEPGGKIETLAKEMIGWGKPVFPLDHPANVNLRALDALDASALHGRNRGASHGNPQPQP